MRAAVAITTAVLIPTPALALSRDAGLASAEAAAPADAPAVVAATTSQEVQLGRTFDLLVTVTYRSGVRVNLPSSLGLGHNLEEGARSHESVDNGDGTVTRTYEVALTPFALGDLQIPPVTVLYTAGGRSHQVSSNPVPVTVLGVIGDGEASLREIAPPVPVTEPNRPLIIAIASTLGVLVIVVGLVVARLVWRRRRGRSSARAARASSRPSAEAEALARLDEIEASGLVDSDDRKRAFLELSETVRGYLGRRYGFPALDFTTSEIKEHLSALPGGTATTESIGDWLERCDLVKFANSEASHDEARQALYEARRFVEGLRPGESERTGGAIRA